MRRRWRLFLVILLGLGLVTGLFALNEASRTRWEPPLPPLLRNVTAGSFRGPACPPAGQPSPELNQRLLEAYPPGTDGARLATELENQGFKMRPPCAEDETIRRASFWQRPKGFLPYTISATAYWKVDTANRVVWTKGFVSYSGL
jgi:hypothetical protein